MQLQTSYSKKLQKGLPGMLARPNAPYDYDLGVINVEMRPGDACFYSASANKFVLPTSTAERLFCTHVVSYDPTSFNSDIASPTTNNGTEVVFAADSVVKLVAFGSVFAVAGETLENEDAVVFNQSTNRWIKYAPASATANDIRRKEFIAYMDPGQTAGNGDIIEIRVCSPVHSQSVMGNIDTNTVKISLTNAQIKALRATPIELVAAPGAGSMIQFEAAILVLNAGTNVLTESTDNLVIGYNSAASTISTIETTGFIDQSVNTRIRAVPESNNSIAMSSVTNKNIAIKNSGDGEFAGNAAADATMDIYVTYRIITL